MGAVLHIETLPLPERLLWDPPLTDDEFETFALSNDWLQLERTKDREIIMNPGTRDDTGRTNAEITKQLGVWWDSHERGAVYDSSTSFFLPDSSNLSPDAAYVLPEKVGPRSGREPRWPATAPTSSSSCSPALTASAKRKPR